MTILTWWVGDQEPGIGDTLTVEGQPVDLTNQDCQFKMRAVGSEELKVDQAVSSRNAQGEWYYEWEADDLDTAGQFLAWLEVGASQQTLWEMLLEVRAHGVPHNYAELEVIKADLGLTGTRSSDTTLAAQIEAVSRGIEIACGRRFWLDPDDSSVRYYRPESRHYCAIDDVVDIAAVESQRSTSASWETWTLDTHYQAEPLNAAADGKPWWWLHAVGSKHWPRRSSGLVRVTGQFGWEAVPAGVSRATALVSTKLFKRTREAPFGIVTFGTDAGVAMRRLAEVDPDVEFLLNGLVKRRPW